MGVANRILIYNISINTIVIDSRVIDSRVTGNRIVEMWGGSPTNCIGFDLVIGGMRRLGGVLVFRGQVSGFTTTDATEIGEYIVCDNVICGLLHPDAIATVAQYQVFNDNVVAGVLHGDAMTLVVHDHIIRDDAIISVQHVDSIYVIVDSVIFDDAF